MKRPNDDEWVNVLKVAQCALITWAVAVVMCGVVWLLWLGWRAFWTAFAELYWVGVP